MDDNPGKVMVGEVPVPPKESYWITAWKTGRNWLLGREGKIFLLFAGIFLFAYYLPLGSPKVQEALLEAFMMLQAYAATKS